MQLALYRRLTELAESYVDQRQPNAAEWVTRLFEALDWGQRVAYNVSKTNSAGFTLNIGKQPVISVFIHNPADTDKTHKALNDAYNRDIPWVVVSDFETTAILGSLWLSSERDTSAATATSITSAELLLSSDKLELLTPDGVSSNRLNELYDAFPGRIKKLPIDRHFVERMAEWRALGFDALALSGDQDDDNVHTLLNSLILIRYLEDSGRMPRTLLAMADQLSDPQLLREVGSLVREKCSAFGYKNEIHRSLKAGRATALRPLIRGLYGYPEWAVLYDFSALSVDVLGRFYEEYLHYREIWSEEKAPDELFGIGKTTRVSLRKEEGIFYTPRYLVDYMVRATLSRFFASMGPHATPVTVDLAAGSGAFLAVAAEAMIQDFGKRPKDLGAIISHLFAFDKDPRAVEAARLNLTTKALALGNSHLPMTINASEHDLLKAGLPRLSLTGEQKSTQADIVLGNPPFQSYEQVISQYDITSLKLHFETVLQRVDSYSLFIEASIKILKPGGLCALVLPRTFLQVDSARKLREWIYERVELLEVVDFGTQGVFGNTGIYVCVLVFRKKSLSTVPSHVTVTRIHELLAVPAVQMAQIVAAERGKGFEVFQAELPDDPSQWTFRLPFEAKLFQSLRVASIRFADCGFESRQGIKTGADEVFVVTGKWADRSKRLFETDSGFTLEGSLLIPLLRGRDMDRWWTKPEAYLIYPYKRENGTLLSWREIEDEFPLTAKYLRINQAHLAKRKSLRGKKWYEIIEPRTESVLCLSSTLFMAELSHQPTACIAAEPGTCILGGAGGGSWITLRGSSLDRKILMAYLTGC